MEALLQLASTRSRSGRWASPHPIDVHLWLGDGTAQPHRYADLQPILVDRAERMRYLLDLPLAPPLWGDPGLRHCGRCDYCKAAAEARRDVLLVAGMRRRSAQAARAGGHHHLEQLAEPDEAPEGMKEPVFQRLHAQAVLQAGQDASRSTERTRLARSPPSW